VTPSGLCGCFGSKTTPAIEPDRHQKDRAIGHALTGENYDIWVLEWGELIASVERRYTFYKEQLKSSITQDEAVERVRSRHEALLNPRRVAKATSMRPVTTDS